MPPPRDRSVRLNVPKARRSAGILLYRRTHGRLEVLLGHPGGPFWTRRDDGAWGIPKGEIDEGEDALQAAKREFLEETGLALQGPFTPLEPIRQPSGKTVFAWAAEGDCDPGTLKSIAFSMEWPPRSGRAAEFPELDRAAWFALDEARRKVLRGQSGFLDQLESLLAQ